MDDGEDMSPHSSMSRLPRLAPKPSDEPGHGQEASTSGVVTRRRPVAAACSACRRKKAKCDARRPKCHRCVRQGLECRYEGREGETPSQTQIRRQVEQDSALDHYESLYEFLRTRNQHDIDALLRRIRSGDDVKSIINAVGDADLLLTRPPTDPSAEPSDEATSAELSAAYSPQASLVDDRQPSEVTTSRGQSSRAVSSEDIEVPACHRLVHPRVLPHNAEVILLGYLEDSRQD